MVDQKIAGVFSCYNGTQVNKDYIASRNSVSCDSEQILYSALGYICLLFTNRLFCNTFHFFYFIWVPFESFIIGEMFCLWYSALFTSCNECGNRKLHFVWYQLFNLSDSHWHSSLLVLKNVDLFDFLSNVIFSEKSIVINILTVNLMLNVTVV